MMYADPVNEFQLLGGTGFALQGQPDNQGQSARAKNVFLSHASEDKEIADRLVTLLHDVSGGVLKVGYSSLRSRPNGIPYGEEWSSWIWKAISQSMHFIAIVTDASLERPWILYEVGLAASDPSIKVFGLDLTAQKIGFSSGPFGILKCVDLDRDSIVKLCKELISGLEINPREPIVESHVDTFLNGTEPILSNRCEAESTRPNDELVVSMITDMRSSILEHEKKRFTYQALEKLHSFNVLTMVMESEDEDLSSELLRASAVGFLDSHGISWAARLLESNLRLRLSTRVVPVLVNEIDIHLKMHGLTEYNERVPIVACIKNLLCD